MSKTIDNRVVEMTFNNKQFEEGISESLTSIKSLNKALYGLDDTEDSVIGIGDAAEKSGHKFTALEVAAITAIANITNRAVDAGIQLVKSLSVDQITAGYNKYEEKTKAMQTIVNATISEDESMEEATDRVSAALDRLNWFTDETSYSFLDMVNNIGKFTSMGVDLDKSVSAMEGISTWAAISGAGIGEAGRAMYNLSQAMGVGAVTAIDWKSIENANMATKEFKETAIETAAQLGYLKKEITAEGEAIYTTEKGMVVNAQNFRETLSSKWFDAEVLTETLQKYGAFADELSGYMEAFDDNTSTSEVVEWLNAYADAAGDAEAQTKILRDVMESSSLSYEEASDMLERLSSKEYELGRRSFLAAQEAKTFTEAIDATKDAVSTGWMNIFEKIFGNYYEAKELWTELANRMYDAFMPGVNTINEVLDSWREAEAYSGKFNYALSKLGDNWDSDTITKWMVSYAETVDDAVARTKLLKRISKQTGKSVAELSDIFEHVAEGEELIGLGGRTDLIQSFWNLWDAFSAINKAVKDAWADVFGSKDTDEKALSLTKFIKKLQELTAAFKEWAEGEGGEKVRKIFKGLFSVLNIGKKIVTALLSPFKSLFSLFGKSGVGGSILDFVVYLGEAITALDAYIDECGILNTVSDAISTALSWVIEKVKDLVGSFEDKRFLTFSEILDRIRSAFEKIGEVIKPVLDEMKRIGSVVGGAIFGAFQNLYNNISDAISPALSWVTEKVKDFASSLKNLASSLEDKRFITFSEILDKIRGAFEKIGEVLKPVWDTMKKIGSVVGGVLSKAFRNLSNNISNLGVDGILDIIKNGGLLVFLFKILEFIETIRARMKGVGRGLSEFLDSLAGAVDAWAANAYATTLSTIAKSIVLIVAAIAVLTFLDAEKVKNAMWTVLEIVGLMIVVLKSVSGLGGAFKVKDGEKIVKMGAVAGILLAFAASVLILVAAVAKLSKIDPERLNNSIMSMAIMMGLLIVAMKQMAKNLTGAIEGAAALLAFARAVKVLAKTAIMLSKVETGPLIRGVAAVGALMFILDQFVQHIKTSGAEKFSLRSAGIILSIAVAMTMLAAATYILGRMKFGTMFQGIMAIGLLLLEIGVFMQVVKEGGNMTSIAMSMILMATAINMLATAVAIFGYMDSEALIQGMEAVALGLAAMVVSILILSAAESDVLKAAAAMDLIAIALLLLIPSVTAFALMPWDKLLIGIAAITALAGIMTGTLVLLSKYAPNAMAAGTAVMLLGAGLALCGVGMVTFAAGLATLVALGAPAIAIITAMGAALITLIPSLFVSVTVGIVEAILKISEYVEPICNVVKDVIDAIINLVIALLPKLGDLFEALVLFINEHAPGIIACVAGVVGLILQSLTELVPDFIALVDAIANGIATLLEEYTPRFIDWLFDTLEKLNERLVTWFPNLCETLLTIISEVLKLLRKTARKVVKWVVNVILDVIEAITDAIPDILDALFKLVIACIDGLAEALDNNHQALLESIAHLGEAVITAIWDALKLGWEKVTEAGSILFEKFIEGAKSVWEAIRQSIADLITNIKKWLIGEAETLRDGFHELFKDGFFKGIEKVMDALKEKVLGIVKKIKDWFKGKDSADQMEDSGKYVLAGIGKGLENSEEQNSLKNKMVNLASKLKGWFEDKLDINSPSRVFAVSGRFIDEGVAKGIDDYSNVAKVATISMADDTLDGMAGVLSSIDKALDDNMDMTPVITPVLDLSEIQNGGGLNALFSDRSVDVTARTINANARNNANRPYDIANAVNTALKSYSDKIVSAIAKQSNDTTVNVTLEGDAAGLFKSIRTQNDRYKAATGKSALI